MSGPIYHKQSERREKLIKRLFLSSANETIKEELGNTKKHPTVAIIYKENCGSSFYYTNLHIEVNLLAIKRISQEGYKDDYYSGRRLLISKYTLHNIHNETRFVIYHELKHFCDYVKYSKNPHLTFGEEEAERRADNFALSKLGRQEGIK